MNYKMLGRFVAQILALETVFMIPPLLLAIFDGDIGTAQGFFAAICIALLLSGICHFCFRSAKTGFYAKEGFLCVGVGWIVLSLVGCLPFYLSGEIPVFIDAFFEMVSGFTTTGASVVENVEALSRACNYWRCFSNWLGGMGVLVFLLAVVPEGGGKSGFTMHLMRAESPGPSVGKLVPRLRQTASILYLMYIALTIVCFIFLLLGHMSVFDSICTAFSTAGTGGFGIKGDSLGGYSPYLQNVCTAFMLLFGVNFSCYYLLLLRQVKSVLADEEVRLYLALFLLSTAAISVNIYRHCSFDTALEAVHHAAFQVSSIMTTTGFATVDFNEWPIFSKTIMLFLMLVGGCAGSTAGGFKCSRVLIMFKSMVANVRQTIHPQKIEVVRINRQSVNEKIVSSTNAYLAAYIVILFTSLVLVSYDGHNLATNLSAVFSCLNNVGPGFGEVGPANNYSMYSGFCKLVLSFDMLAGRLEIFPILALFTRDAWGHR